MMSESTRDTTPRPYHDSKSKSKGKGKEKALIVSSDEDFEMGEGEEDELDDENDSDFDIKPKIRGRGGKIGKQKKISITDDVLYHHRSVSFALIPHDVGVTDDSFARNVLEVRRMSCSTRLRKGRASQRGKNVNETRMQ
jgi:hypothetical protein